MIAASNKTSFRISRIHIAFLLLAVASLVSGCAIKVRHDLTRPSPGFESTRVADANLKPFPVVMTDFEDGRTDKSLYLSSGPFHKEYLTESPNALATAAIRLHFQRKGFTVLERSEPSSTSPFVVHLTGKLWRFTVHLDNTGSRYLNLWVQIQISDAAGKLLAKDVIKIDAQYIVGQGDWPGIEVVLRRQLDNLALQTVVATLTSQTKLIGQNLQSLTDSEAESPITTASLQKYREAMAEYMEEIETLDLQNQVTTASGRDAKAAQDSQINSLMQLQKSLDGVRATLPAP